MEIVCPMISNTVTSPSPKMKQKPKRHIKKQPPSNCHRRKKDSDCQWQEDPVPRWRRTLSDTFSQWETRASSESPITMVSQHVCLLFWHLQIKPNRSNAASGMKEKNTQKAQADKDNRQGSHVTLLKRAVLQFHSVWVPRGGFPANAPDVRVH